jgi:hypothetical protein
MLLATATPVQLDPIEAYDLLCALNLNNESVLGSTYSRWARPTDARVGLDYVLGREEPPTDLATAWDWMRDPFPPPSEGRDYGILRKALNMPDTQVWATYDALETLRARPPDYSRARGLVRPFFPKHNPYIRHIVRRTREYLENTLDPRTHEPYLKPVVARLFGESTKDAVALSGFLRDAYTVAEEFCELVCQRPGVNSGFLKTILLRRIGSTVVAGRITAEKMLAKSDPDTDDEEDEIPASPLYPLTEPEEEKLRAFLTKLDAAPAADPKFAVVETLLRAGTDGTGPWLERGCILFSQYYDSARWVAEQLSWRFPQETVALYAGGSRSGLFRAGEWTRLSREAVKEIVTRGDARILVGTDAASEGLNLQKIGTLINLDLPWNPTRLEQRKGRIQRIGQVRDEVLLYNIRYRGSVEDRVHELLSTRLAAISDLFGQIPDTLEDVWVAVALHQEHQALQIIDAVPPQSPFELRYDKIEPVDWESCSTVLDTQPQLDLLLQGWQ